MLNPAAVIQKKRDGETLSEEEIESFVNGLSTGEVADYQASAFLMAVYFQGMSLNETVALTRAMVKSGDHYDLSHIPGPKVDKHSTGGVGDKVSLILAPLAAACGLKVPMMSGRALGDSGGTLDKLESIPGFRVDLEHQEFEKVLEKTGSVMVGPTGTIAPADKKLYALRDVTATVESVPLIAASILSKKIAEGTDALVIDVKVGSGAFMKTLGSARQLAKMLIQVAKKMGLSCRAVISNMNQPLGCTVGNSLEVIESIKVLRNESCADHPELKTSDLREITIQLCAHMLELSGKAKNRTEARKLAHKNLENGKAWERFVEMVEAQGGATGSLKNMKELPVSSRVLKWGAKKKGYLTKMDTGEIGRLLVEMGGGRRKASDVIDPGVGFVFHKKLGARVQEGEPIASVYAPEGRQMDDLEERFCRAMTISSARKPVPKLILDPCIK